MQVATALERRLAETEKELERLESLGPELAQPEGEDLSSLFDDEEDSASSEVRPPDEWTPLSERSKGEERPAEELMAEVARLREERARQETKLAGLSKHEIARERELRRLVAQSATAGDLATRL